jgi:hypothetical protein
MTDTISNNNNTSSNNSIISNENLDKLKRRELRDLCIENNITGYSKNKKPLILYIISKKELFININEEYKVKMLKEKEKKIKKSNNNHNNETIGQCAEAAVCEHYNIEYCISEQRLDNNTKQKLIKLLKDKDLKNILSCEIIESCGYKNGSIDFKLEGGKTLSLKTLKWKGGKICPQKVGQPTLKSWDNIWKQEFSGAVNKNPERWKFIKSNIHKYLNTMLEGVFCCDNLLIIKNCSSENPCLTYYETKSLKKKLDYFKDQIIIYTREEYEERWNQNKKKNSEMSSTISMDLSGERIVIGEFQFHKNSRKELKFRFMNTFLEKLF